MFGVPKKTDIRCSGTIETGLCNRTTNFETEYVSKIVLNIHNSTFIEDETESANIMLSSRF